MSCLLATAAAVAGDSILNHIEDFGDCPEDKLNDCTDVRAQLIRQYPLADLRVIAVQRGVLNAKAYTSDASGNLILKAFDYQWTFPNFKKGTVQTPAGASSDAPFETTLPTSNNDGRLAFAGATADDARKGGAFVWTPDMNPAIHFLQLHDGAATAVDPKTSKPRDTLVESLPCNAAQTAALPGCTWLAKFTVNSAPSGTGLTLAKKAPNGGGRRAADADADAAAAADESADRELLQLLLSGDGDAHDHFQRSGGRVLGDGSVIMPSGRRLDDGSVIKVGLLWTAAARDALGGLAATIRSRITAAMTSANTVLNNSGIGFQFAYQIGRTTFVEPATGGLEAIVRDWHARQLAELFRRVNHIDLVQVVAATGGRECSVSAQLTHLTTPADTDYIALSAAHYSCLGYGTWGSLNGFARNLGAQGISTEFPSDWSYARAYTTCLTPGATYQTVMGDNTFACPAMPRLSTFSSPIDWSLGWLALKRGTASKDNARVLESTRSYVANYRLGA
ncbi:hypothetical protein JKP88DRAFT_273931 [Tribonema minus]|uniref:Uncharacterized protein n=1 Tax=Tribonema minus TaxID=303371 RepID=A0A835YPH0_9STRA|nr:hypothetical protein JKP88DRAFT_273931 [Tribonema minus]